MTVDLAYSPCPNDTFIFDAMVHGRVDAEGLSFRTHLADVEELNERAMLAKRPGRDGSYAVTKLSYAALAHLQDEYRLLDAGSALGEGIGPLLVTRGGRTVEQLTNEPVAIPGEYTTAAFLLRLAYPRLRNLTPLLFSEIEGAIERGEVAAGVIIHETRFTYAERGFELLRDLGTFWTEETGLPIPLGGIAVRRDLDIELQHRLGRVLRRSVVFAKAHPEASRAYVQAHAQEMSEEIQAKHIATYVNNYSESLGARGREAITRMFSMAHERGIVGEPVRDLLVDSGSSH